MLRDKDLNVLFFYVLNGILLQDERHLGTTLEGVTAETQTLGHRYYWRRHAGQD